MILKKESDQLVTFSNKKTSYQKIGTWVLLFSAILLITPFLNPLASPLNNPNTNYNDLPEPLQQANNQELFTKIINTIKPQQAFAASQVGTITRGDTWQKEIIAQNSTHTTTKALFGLS